MRETLSECLPMPRPTPTPAFGSAKSKKMQQTELFCRTTLSCGTSPAPSLVIVQYRTGVRVVYGTRHRVLDCRCGLLDWGNVV